MDSPRCPGCGAELRTCRQCGAVMALRPGRGRPRVYCSDACRWKHGHAVARERAADRAAGMAGWSTAELADWMSTLTAYELQTARCGRAIRWP